jgi:hypothetical protein
MTKSKQYILFKFVRNGLKKSHLPFTSSNQQYFKNQYCFHSISFRAVHFLSNGNLAHPSLLHFHFPDNNFKTLFTNLSTFLLQSQAPINVSVNASVLAVFWNRWLVWMVIGH